jgi:hypothetical protein
MLSQAEDKEGFFLFQRNVWAMAQCKAKNSKGEQCRLPGKDSGYCKHHYRPGIEGVTHGLTARRETLGIPDSYHDVYQSFYQSDAPTDLRRELAQSRTIFVELRDALLSGDKRDECASRIVGVLKEILEDEVPLSIIDEHSVVLVEKIVELLKPYMPLSNMRMETADGLTKLLDRTANIAQKMKKIQEGMVLKVEVNQTILVQFLQQVVFPVVVSTEQRQALAERASQFALRRTSAVDDIPQVGALSRAEQGPDILKHL